MASPYFMLNDQAPLKPHTTSWAGQPMSWNKLTIQEISSFPPRSGYHASSHPQPLPRAHRRPVSSTPAGRTPMPYGHGSNNVLESDQISEYRPPTGTRPRQRDHSKDVMGTTAGWAPHSANLAGSQRAVYDPVSHKTTLFTFTEGGGVGRQEGKGDSLLLDKRQRDLNAGVPWHGRRKGVVEFVDRTHFYAVNANKEFRETCARNEHAFHPKKGDLTHWMDVALLNNLKPAPFKGK